MAKPIIIIQLPLVFLFKKTDFKRELEDLENFIKNSTDNEYHVISIASNVKEIKFDCYNDNKGLKDEDIEALIKTVHNMYEVNPNIILNK